MKKQTPQEKQEQREAEQLRLSTFERAQQICGYQADIESIIIEAKKIIKFVKGK